MIPTNALLTSLLVAPQSGSSHGMTLGYKKPFQQEIEKEKPSLMPQMSQGQINTSFVGQRQISSQNPSTAAPKKNIYKLILPEVFKEQFDKEGENRWRQQNADITDYFNYGFCEATFQAYANKIRIQRGKFTVPEDYDGNGYKLDKLNDNIPLDYGGCCIPIDEGILETPQGFNLFKREQFVQIVLEDYSQVVNKQFGNHKNDIINLLQKRNILSKYIQKQTEEDNDSKDSNEIQTYRYFASNLSQYSLSENYAEYKKKSRIDIDFIALYAQIIHNISQKNESIDPNCLEKVYFFNEIFKNEKQNSPSQQPKKISLPTTTTTDNQKLQAEYKLPTMTSFMQRGVMPFPQQSYYQMQQQYLSQLLKSQMVMGGQQGLFPMMRNPYMGGMVNNMRGGMNPMGMMGFVGNMSQQQQMMNVQNQLYQMQQQNEEDNQEGRVDDQNSSEERNEGNKGRVDRNDSNYNGYRGNKGNGGYRDQRGNREKGDKRNRESEFKRGNDFKRGRDLDIRENKQNFDKKIKEKKQNREESNSSSEKNQHSDHTSNQDDMVSKNISNRDNKQKIGKFSDSISSLNKPTKNKKSRSRSRSSSKHSKSQHQSRKEKDKKREKSHKRDKERYKKEKDMRNERNEESNERDKKKEKQFKYEKKDIQKGDSEKDRKIRYKRDKSESFSREKSQSNKSERKQRKESHEQNSKILEVKDFNQGLERQEKQIIPKVKIDVSQSFMDRIKKKVHPKETKNERSRSRSKQLRQNDSLSSDREKRSNSIGEETKKRELKINKESYKEFRDRGQKDQGKQIRQLSIVKDNRIRQTNEEYSNARDDQNLKKVKHSSNGHTQNISQVSQPVNSAPFQGVIQPISKRPSKEDNTKDRKNETHRNFISSFFSAIKKNDEREDNFSKLKSNAQSSQNKNNHQNTKSQSQSKSRSVSQTKQRRKK